MFQRHLIVPAAILLLFPGALRAAAPQDLASQVQVIFKNNCYRCHGEKGAAEGGMAYVTDLAKLVERKKVVPGNPAGSKLYKKIASEDDPMPPLTDDDNKPIIQRPSKDQIALVRQWIEAGAPAEAAVVAGAARGFISDDEIFVAIQKDVHTVDERSRIFLRYFTVTHLYNAGLADDELETYRGGLSKLINSLSWGRRVVVPVAVDDKKTVFRIDLRDYKWNEKTWEKILGAYPYKLPRWNPAAVDVYAQIKSPSPYVRADWFVFAASRPPLYHDVLDLPKTDLELERLLKVDVVEDIRTERVARAGFNGSGVSRNNRLIERHDSPYGAYWKSYDFKHQGDNTRKNLFSHPLGPGDKIDNFEQDGGEIIFNLPNGLQAYMLVNGKGERIDKGPTEVVSDPKQEDRAVVNGVSCMSCHAKGMIEKSDQVRETVLSNAAGYEAATVELVKALYPTKADFDALLKDDADRFANAVERTGAAKTKSEPVVSLSLRFQSDLEEPLAAAEAGLNVKEFREAISGSNVLAPALGALTIAGGTVQRDVYVSSFSDLVERAGKLKFLHHQSPPDPKELAALERRANAGEPAAMYDLAIRYQVAYGVPLDLGRAITLVSLAAEKGYVPAMLRLSNMYGIDGLDFLHPDLGPVFLGVQTDLTQAIAWSNRAADAGSPAALLQLADCYDKGLGVAKDASQAAMYNDKAVSATSASLRTDPTAPLCDFILTIREKIPRSEDIEVFSLLTKAADQGDANSLSMLALLESANDRPRDMRNTLELTLRGANRGSVTCMISMGLLLKDIDPAQARTWFQKGVDVGVPNAMQELAAMYLNGIGGAKDERRAVQLVQQGADAGNYGSMLDLANRYEKGLGVPQNIGQATTWMRKAASSHETGEYVGPAKTWLKEHGENP